MSFFFSILQEGNLFWLRVRDGMSVLKLLMLCWSYTVMLSSRVLEKPHCHLLHELFWFYLFFALEPNISRTASSDHSDWNISLKIKKQNKKKPMLLIFGLWFNDKARSCNRHLVMTCIISVTFYVPPCTILSLCTIFFRHPLFLNAYV